MRRATILWTVVLVALALRLPGLWTDFWLDEIWALQNVGSLSSALGVVTDIHHDSNHWLMSLWMYLVGPEAPFWLYRWPSLVAGLGTVLAAGWLARADGTSRLLAMLLVAVSFPLGYYASEARGYALAACASLLSLGCLLKWVVEGRRRWLVAFWAAAAGGLLAHLSFVIVLAAAAVLLSAAYARGRVSFAEAAAPLGVPALLLMLLWLFDLRFLTLGGGPPLDVRRLLAEVGALTVGAPIDLSITPLLAILGGVSLAVALVVHACSLRSGMAGEQTAHELELVFYVSVFVLPLAVALALHPPFFFPRYFLVSLAFVPMVLASALTGVSTRLRTAGVIAFALLSLWSWTGFWRDGRGHYAAAVEQMLAAAAGRGATVASDHDFRNGTVIGFYIDRLGLPGQCLTYVEEADDADFVVVSDRRRFDDAAPCAECELLGQYPSSLLSGTAWQVYGAGPHGPSPACDRHP